MGELALAVVLAASILVASTISVEVGFSVALIELSLETNSFSSRQIS